MAGRIYVQPNSLTPRQQHHSHHHETQSLQIDNQRLAATHVVLKQELAVALQDLRHFSAASGNIKSERDAELREVYEKAMKMETEVRSIDELSADLVQVKNDVQKLSLERKEFNEKLNRVQGELLKEKLKGGQISGVQSEIESMRKEIQKGRAAIEYEKKVYAANIDQGQAMEKSMISMAREIVKLQTDLANAHKKAMAIAAAAATNTPGNLLQQWHFIITVFCKKMMKCFETGTGYAAGYGGNVYQDPYAMHQVLSWIE